MATFNHHKLCQHFKDTSEESSLHHSTKYCVISPNPVTMILYDLISDGFVNLGQLEDSVSYLEKEMNGFDGEFDDNKTVKKIEDLTNRLLRINRFVSEERLNSIVDEFDRLRPASSFEENLDEPDTDECDGCGRELDDCLCNECEDCGHDYDDCDCDRCEDCGYICCDCEV